MKQTSGAGGGTLFMPKSLADSDLFRLTITEADDSYEDFLLLDEVLDRRQFVGAFCDVFEQFLVKNYKVNNSSEGEYFDLRTLPLTGLKDHNNI